MSSSDLTVEAFLLLRNTFFDAAGDSVPFTLRDKRNTQDDPLDEYIVTVLNNRLADVRCQKAPGPLISPDLVLYRPEQCEGVSRVSLLNDVSRIVAIEVKKVERQASGQVARSTGLDYNTTPPCGTVRIYDAREKALDIRSFYLFVCQERIAGGTKVITALVLCDGNALNADFNLYLQITGQRTKGLGLGTYGDGVNRERPMLIFANPLGAAQLDRACTLVSQLDFVGVEPRIGMVYEIGRTIPEGGQGIFYSYRMAEDIQPDWELQRLVDPFPQPITRVSATQARGKFKLMINPTDE